MSDPARHHPDWDTPEAEARYIVVKAHAFYRDLLDSGKLSARQEHCVVIDSNDATAQVIAEKEVEADTRFLECYPEPDRKPALFRIGAA